MELKDVKNVDRIELYSIKDCVADEFGPLFQAKNLAVAIRQYKQLLSKAVDARDYELWRVGYLYNDMHIECNLNVVYDASSLEDGLKQVPFKVGVGEIGVE